MFPLQVSNGDCPHLLFYGPPGAGKKTLIIGLLRELYGPPVEKVLRPSACLHAA
jgi:replication factor C subunit 3/5